MAERRFAIKAVGVDYVCDECGGIMEPHGNAMWMTNPPQIPHRCNHCGALKGLFVRYPTVRYERIELPLPAAEAQA